MDLLVENWSAIVERDMPPLLQGPACKCESSYDDDDDDSGDNNSEAYEIAFCESRLPSYGRREGWITLDWISSPVAHTLTETVGTSDEVIKVILQRLVLPLHYVFLRLCISSMVSRPNRSLLVLQHVFDSLCFSVMKCCACCLICVHSLSATLQSS